MDFYMLQKLHIQELGGENIWHKFRKTRQFIDRISTICAIHNIKLLKGFFITTIFSALHK